ncbi:BRCA2, helical [Musa troglodytarum]|uniref:BRCA2, helical n=1 Tax=Musa troglodytarum TaxID=320322 RepID=A0A9E7JHW3_9LILI|nr:BRCA2, helical [Musa troglodytarum]
MFSTGSGKLVTSPVKFQTAGGRFITPLKGSTSLLATGSSKPSTTESSCCGRISTRYPFQLKRKNLKDFFGGPPTCQDLSGSLPHEVSNMDADNAVTYRFYDASHHDEIGLEAFQVMLLKSGASSSNATKDSYSVACDLHSMQESVGQLKSTLAEPVESKGKYVENFQQNQGNIDQDADMCFSLDFPNGHLKTTGPVDSFRPKANSQNDDKELGVEESFCASTLCSGCNQTQATHSEINAAQQLIQAEQSILLNTSGDKEWVQSGDIDASTKLSSMDSLYDLSHSSGATGMEAIVEDANLATPSSGSNILSSELNATQQPLLIAKEFAALKSTDDRLQVSFSDGDLRAFLDNQRSDVRQVGKFQPRNKSQPKKCSNRSPRGGRRIEKKLDFQRVWRILILSPNPKMFKNLSSGSMKEGLLQKMMKMMTLINHMDGSRSDDCHRDEDMPKPKRTKRKSKRQTNEIEKPTLKHKKAFEKPDYVVENSPKKKFPHATRRRRRQVLFLCPIMRTFFLERIKNNHSGEEANQNVQSTPKRLNYHSYMNRPQSSRWSKAETKLFYEVHRPVMKNDLEVVTKIQHRGGCRK